VAITNAIAEGRLTSTIEYVDGTEESMNWELFSPEAIAERAARVGFEEVERCTWWDEGRVPTAAEQRYQIVLTRP
jgi:hypothetical protein